MNPSTEIDAKLLRKEIRVALRDVIEMSAFLLANELVTAEDDLPQIQKSLDEAKYAVSLLYHLEQQWKS